MLDRFYDTVSEAVFANEGQVNKFMGDAVLALFGALPEEPPNHAERAIRAALHAQAEIRRWSQSESVRALGVPFDTGAGVNTGEATVGLVGKRRIRIEYTALGDAVNIASRLQTAARAGEVIIGEQSMAAVGGPQSTLWAQLDLAVGAGEEMVLKGKSHPMPIWRLRLSRENRKESES